MCNIENEFPCGDSCVDLSTDVSNCGYCGNVVCYCFLIGFQRCPANDRCPSVLKVLLARMEPVLACP